MPDNVKITINSKEEFTGRLVGLIGSRECMAIMNVEDAARKIFSAESMVFKDIPIATNKRFVVATSDYSSDGSREIFISATVRSMSYIKDGRIFKCNDNNSYKVEEL